MECLRGVNFLMKKKLTEEDIRDLIKKIIAKSERKAVNKVKKSLIENKKGYRRKAK